MALLPANIGCPCNSVNLITLVPGQSHLCNWKPSLMILVKFPDLWKLTIWSHKTYSSPEDQKIAEFLSLLSTITPWISSIEKYIKGVFGNFSSIHWNWSWNKTSFTLEMYCLWEPNTRAWTGVTEHALKWWYISGWKGKKNLAYLGGIQLWNIWIKPKNKAWLLVFISSRIPRDGCRQAQSLPKFRYWINDVLKFSLQNQTRKESNWETEI